MISTLVVNGWAVTFGTARRSHGRTGPSSLAVPNVTAHPSTASVAYQLHIIRCSNIIAFESVAVLGLGQVGHGLPTPATGLPT